MEASKERRRDDGDKNRKRRWGKKQELTREWSPEQWNTRARRVELRGTAPVQAENTSERGMKKKKKKTETLNVCQSVWNPVSASLPVNFAPVGAVAQRKRVLTLFTRRGDSRSPSAAVLLLSSGHVYKSQMIWSELRRVRARRNWLHHWCQRRSRWCDPHSPSSLRVTSQKLRGKGRIKSNQFLHLRLHFYRLYLDRFLPLWHVLAGLFCVTKMNKKEIIVVTALETVLKWRSWTEKKSLTDTRLVC